MRWCFTFKIHPGLSYHKNLPASAGATKDVILILGSGRFPWSRKWQRTLQYSCWENKWTEEPRGLLSMGLQMVGDDWAHTNVISNLSAPSLIWIIVVDHMLNIYGLRVSKSQVVALCPWLPVFSVPSSLLIHPSPRYILYMRALIQILWQSWLHKFNIQPLKTIFFSLRHPSDMRSIYSRVVRHVCFPMQN